MLAQGRAEEALASAREAHEQLQALGAIEEGDAMVRLAYAECLNATGARPAAIVVIEDACRRLRERAATIRDPDLRKRFLTDVPVHARMLQHATSWTAALDLPRGDGLAAS